MRIVTNKEYYERVREFVSNNDMYRVETSPLESDTYIKTYYCENGACGHEINRVVYEDVEVEVKGLKFKVTVKLLETEWFDSINAESIYMYERF